MIEVKDITKIYKSGAEDFQALKGITFTIQDGEYVAIMGPSGSGKSTLMHILGALDSPFSGTYLLDEKDVSTLSDDELADIRREKIGFVFQSFNLLPRATVLRNVSLPLVYEGIHGTERDKRTKAILFDSGLEESHFGHLSNQLSGGQMQRVAIARAMLKGAPVLILDEATSSLDSISEQHIQEAFDELMKGRTTLVIAHRLSTIQKMDRIIVFDKGTIVGGRNAQAVNRQERPLL